MLKKDPRQRPSSAECLERLRFLSRKDPGVGEAQKQQISANHNNSVASPQVDPMKWQLVTQGAGISLVNTISLDKQL